MHVQSDVCLLVFGRCRVRQLVAHARGSAIRYAIRVHVAEFRKVINLESETIPCKYSLPIMQKMAQRRLSYNTTTRSFDQEVRDSFR